MVVEKSCRFKNLQLFLGPEFIVPLMLKSKRCMIRWKLKKAVGIFIHLTVNNRNQQAWCLLIMNQAI